MIERKWYRFTLNGVTYRVLARSADAARDNFTWWVAQGSPETEWIQIVSE